MPASIDGSIDRSNAHAYSSIAASILEIGRLELLLAHSPNISLSEAGRLGHSSSRLARGKAFLIRLGEDRSVCLSVCRLLWAAGEKEIPPLTASDPGVFPLVVQFSTNFEQILPGNEAASWRARIFGANGAMMCAPKRGLLHFLLLVDNVICVRVRTPFPISSLQSILRQAIFSAWSERKGRKGGREGVPKLTHSLHVGAKGERKEGRKEGRKGKDSFIRSSAPLFTILLAVFSSYTGTC